MKFGQETGYYSSTPILDRKDWQRMTSFRSVSEGYTPLSPLKQDLQGNMPPPMLTTWGACWTILNTYLGLGLQSKPYAIAKGGWISLITLGIVAIVANISAKQLVGCFKSPRCYYARSYAQVVHEVLGFWGVIVLLVFITLEVLAAVSMCLIFMWANLEKLLPGVEEWMIVVFSTLVCIPSLWLTKFSDTSLLPLLGFSSTILITFTLIFVWGYYGKLSGNADMGNIIGSNVSLSTGIFMVSFAGHAALPQVYREMKKPEEFNRMLDVSFIIMFLIYAGAGVVGYLIYGTAVNIIVSTNLVGNPGGVFAIVASGLTIVKNYLSLNPMVAVLCDSTEIMMDIGDLPFQQRAYRTIVFIFAVLLSYLAMDVLPFLEGLTGAISIMITTFIIPSTLIGLLYKESSSTTSKAMSISLSVFGFIMMFYLSYGAVLSLMLRS